LSKYLRTINVHLSNCMYSSHKNVEIVGLIKRKKIKGTTEEENGKNSSVIPIPTSQITLLVD